MNQWHYIRQSGHMKNKVGIQNKIIKSIAKTYHTIGGTVVCGTDSPAGVFNYPGMALHRELELFVESGFSEFEALRAASIISADAMNKKNLGRITEGALADLVILNSNPIQAISNTKDISSVIKGGQVYTSQALLDTVPSEEENQATIEKILKKFEVNKLPVGMFK